MTKRFAIIIESGNVAGQDDLPGARKDAKNWEAFLRSKQGGTWGDDEIRVLHKPRLVEVAILNILHKNEYVFLAFSGHGEEVVDRSTGKAITRVCLNEHELSVDTETLSPSQFGTAIFDCCRGVENAVGHIELLNEASRGGRQTMAFTTTHAKSASVQLVNGTRKTYRATEDGCRKTFLHALESKSMDPAVYMYSCGKNEGAGEDPSAGGYYTTLLINGAKDWFEAQKTDPYYRVYTTKTAHDFAVKAMSIRNPQQHPEYIPFNQNYPFAVG